MVLGGILGSWIARKKMHQCIFMIDGQHMDEVGFIGTNINSKRNVWKVSPLGWNPYVVSAQRFTLLTRKGDYPIISSSIPPHLLRAAGGQQAAVK